MVRSFFEAPRTVYLNASCRPTGALQVRPAYTRTQGAARGDGLKSGARDRGEMVQPGKGAEFHRRHERAGCACTPGATSSAAFSRAAPRPRPFRRFLARESYRVEAGEKITSRCGGGCAA